MSFRPNAPSAGSVSWVVAAVFGLLFCLLQAGAMASLLVHQAGFRWVAPAALLAALAAGYGLAVREGLPAGARVRALVWCAVLVALAAGWAGFYYDFSWDGEWYHQTAILSIARGWNPLTEPMRLFVAPLKDWVRHYPKGPWYAAGTIFAATGRVELGKAVDGLVFAAMAAAVLGAALDAGWSRRRAWAVTAVIALNPVVLSELTTFLVDEIMFALLVVAAAAAATALAGRARPAVVVAGIAGAIACINAKFTGLVFLCFAAAAAALWCWAARREKFRRFVAISALTLVAGTCVWGYNPYVTNTLNRGQPFFPVLGAARYPGTRNPEEANEHGETPKNIVAKNRLVRFGYSIFGRPGNQPYQRGKYASLMWPFDVHREDLYAYHYQETRVAGFGPYFSACFLFSLGLGLWLVATGRQCWSLGLISGAIAGSLLINAALWWPRYGPQLWLLPVLPLIFIFHHERAGRLVAAAWVLAALLIANAAVVGAVHLRWEARASLRLRGQLTTMRESGQAYDVSTRYFTLSADERLTEAGVRFNDVGNKRASDWTELTSVVEGYPLPNLYHLAAPLK